MVLPDGGFVALYFDNAGTLLGRRKNRLRITLDPSGDSFTSRFINWTVDLSDVESASTEGDLCGSRMELEPFA